MGEEPFCALSNDSARALALPRSPPPKKGEPIQLMLTGSLGVGGGGVGCPLSLRRRPLSRIHRGEKGRKKREEDGLSALLSLPLTLEGTVGSGVVRKFFSSEKRGNIFPLLRRENWPKMDL